MWKSMVVVTGALAMLSGPALAEHQQAPAAGPAQAPAPAQAQAQAQPLDLNTATAEDLEKLPGIGPALAERILEYRQQAGRFTKIEELMNVRGIGERSFLNLRALVKVAPPPSE